MIDCDCDEIIERLEMSADEKDERIKDLEEQVERLQEIVDRKYPDQDAGCGFSTGDMSSGELEMKMNVFGAEGSVFLSKSMWQALGERAGFDSGEKELSELPLPVDWHQQDVEDKELEEHIAYVGEHTIHKFPNATPRAFWEVRHKGFIQLTGRDFNKVNLIVLGLRVLYLDQNDWHTLQTS